MDPVPADLLGRPFTVAHAAAAGVGRRALQGPQYASVHHGVFRAASTPDTLDLRVRGALLVLPDDAALSHQSALAWVGYDALPAEPLHFSTASGSRVDRRGIVVHRRQALLRSRLVRDVPVLDPARTFVDVATDVGDRALLRVGDWLVRWGHVDLLELRAFAAAQHLDGVQRARRIAPLVRERVDSVRESDIRFIIWSAGLPLPEPNVPIVDDAGVRVAKGDLVYVRHRVVVEHDGWHHERDAAQRQRDHLRRERIEALGWRVVVITVQDFDDERQIAWRVHAALSGRGYRGTRPRFGG
ncbi:DUF559 domain-containing protein [Aeromicrobium fastidiosum]|uniref:DUF559 domain-containing protein n=1 Tax=Aeromicrobium fastidiosum TaxID=52699 RepID=UPI0020231C89|nr:DUF559 domain-containing protein [Aeromicrobium fastidiosum]MCL8252272.1 DUF559 domain-containing protein [Aeromicrobium fastidiosum]